MQMHKLKKKQNTQSVNKKKMPAGPQESPDLSPNNL